MKLAIQECGRKLAAHLRARAHAQREQMRRSLFEKYIPEVAQALSEILGMPKETTEKPFYKAMPKFVHVADDAPSKEKIAKADGGVPPPAESRQSMQAMTPPKKASKDGKA